MTHTESSIHPGRYRIDRLIEQRGLAAIFVAWDLVDDVEVEVYRVPPIDGSASERARRARWLEQVRAWRTSTSSPFLLAVRDAQIEDTGEFHVVTERFDGVGLDVPLGRGQRAHPWGALCLAHQLCLALEELHRVGLVHGGLAPRGVRLSRDQTFCKIVDFEHTAVRDDPSFGLLQGDFPSMPPERWSGAPASLQQDLYRLGHLLVRLLCGRTPATLSAPLRARSEPNALEVEAPDFPDRLVRELSGAVDASWVSFATGNPWADERIRESCSRRFLVERLVPLLASCLAPNPADRPASCGVLASTLQELGVPALGHLADPAGNPVTDSIFPGLARGE